MAGVAAAVAVGAVVAGGAIASSVAAKGAASNAKNAQIDALNNVQYADTAKVNSDALAADTARYKNQFALQESVDPTTASLRTTGASNVLNGLQQDPSENSIIDKLSTESAADAPQRQALINQLFSQAQDELNQGATLPPSFQQELVRSGLESSGGSGTTGSGAANVQSRTLLGSAGLALQQQRQTQASNLLSAADQLKQNRAAILSNALGSVESAKNSQQARNINAYTVGANAVPQAGLTGNDIANLDLANTNLKNQVTLSRGNVNANYALAVGAANQKLIGGLTSAATGAVGGIGGGAGGGAGSYLSGLGGGGGGGMTTPQYLNYPTTNAYGYTSGYGQGSYLV